MKNIYSIEMKSNKKGIYVLNVTIENKPFLKDPEGETILKDLILKDGYHDIINVKTAKLLKIKIKATDKQEAESIVKKMCDELRIYNPIVSKCQITINPLD